MTDIQHHNLMNILANIDKMGLGLYQFLLLMTRWMLWMQSIQEERHIISLCQLIRIIYLRCLNVYQKKLNSFKKVKNMKFIVGLIVGIIVLFLIVAMYCALIVAGKSDEE